MLTQNSNLDEIDERGRQNFVVRPSPVFLEKATNCQVNILSLLKNTG